MTTTTKELLTRIDEIRPVLERNADQTEAERRVAQENIEALESVGAFKVTVPRRYGGYEMTPRDHLEVSAAIAESCGSTAWVVALHNIGTWVMGLLSERAQDEVFGGEAEVRSAGALTIATDVRKVDGGYVVSGKWPWSSGSWSATWGLLGIVVPDEDGNPVDQGQAVVPMSELSVEETWFVAGMKGTGSNTILAEEVFVPEHRVTSTSRELAHDYATEHREESLYQASFVPFLAIILLGPQLGLGRAALRFVLDKAPKRGIAYTQFERQTESTGFQLQVAEAAMLIDTAHLHAWRATEDIQRAAEAGEDLPYLTRARVREDTAYGITRITRALDMLMSAHGASSFADVSPLQRIWRDSNVAARHAVADPFVNQEIYGKALLGIPLEESITPLI